MADYTKTTNFLAKDSLPLNNAAKYVKGSEIDTEFNNIATADADNLKVSALGTGVETFLGTPSSANLAAAITDETGTGVLVFATSPTLVTPLLGTPTSGVLTNCTGTAAGLTAGVASAVAVGGITGLGTNVATALAVNLGSAGALASLATAQTFTKPQRGTQTANAASTSFDLNATNNFTCTTTGDSALTFTNIASATGQGGNILFINGGTHTITAAANTKMTAADLAVVSVTGTYLLGYYCDGTNAYVTTTAKFP